MRALTEARPTEATRGYGGVLIQSGSLPHGFVLQTKDLEEAASLLSDAAIPYASELLPGSPAFSTKIFLTNAPRISLSRVVTTGRLRVKSRLPEDSFAIVLDLGNGLGVHRIEQESIPVDSEHAFIQSPLQEVEVITPPGYGALFLRLPRTLLHDELQRMLDRQVHADLVFAPDFRLRSAAGQSLRELCGNCAGFSAVLTRIA